MRNMPSFRASLSLILAYLFSINLLMAEKESEAFQFDGSMARPVLENYLSRAVTHAGLCASSADPTTKYFEDDLRMLLSIGAKFIGRAAFVWDLPKNDNAHFQAVANAAQKVHAADPEIIIQAAIFEIVARGVNRIPIPAWVFTELDLPVEQRNFNYEAMLFDDGKFHNHWRGVDSVPDMSKLETRLWFYYRARRYIDCGIEAIHFGQVKLMDDADPSHRHWIDMLTRVRNYAKQHARRRFILCDAHTNGISENNQLLFDFHSYPMRLRDVPGKPMQVKLADNQPGDIYPRSVGGVTPSGWSCDSLPYLVEFDNYGYSGRGGESVGGIWVWGYDEMSWYAHSTPEARADFLNYATRWLDEHPSSGFLQIATRRLLAAPANGQRMYHANLPSEACPVGFGDEAAIRELWSKNAS